MQENEKRVQNLLLADAYFRAGMLAQAIETYPGEIPYDKLITCGDKCISRKDYLSAFDAYRNASAASKLIELGDLCAKSKAGTAKHLVALDCFLAAKATERLVKLGDKYLSGPFRSETEADVTIALRAYSAANAAAKLIELGDACYENNRADIAFEAYKRAEAVEKLIMVGDHFMSQQTEVGNSNPTHHACKAYRAANAHDKMLLCANWYIQQGKVSHNIHGMQFGFKIYKEVGAELPMEMLNDILDHHVANRTYDDAECVAGLIARVLANQEAPEEAVPSEQNKPEFPEHNSKESWNQFSAAF